ncbi:unnamed protein product [Zymoseptoria tritici ST99CH_3D1]|nr:unnamed protein product [Zymoseptoria tritici ST99CH_3D1]
MTASWQGGAGASQSMPPFASQLDGASNNNEDWEDWLRWDPAAEPTSPDDTFNSASSKNDSPLQDPAFLAPFGQNDDESRIPPLIVDDENFGFGPGSADLGQDSLLFGGTADFDTGFDFPQPSPLDAFSTTVPKLDSHAAAWPVPSTDMPDLDVLLSNGNDDDQQVNIAASLAATTPSLHHSPGSTTNTRQSISSNSPEPPKKRGGRKRKAEVAAEPSVEDGENGENGDSQDGDGPPVKKTSHNVIEKRYRNNLNDKIVELRNSVPSLRAVKRAKNGGNKEELGGLTPAHKLNKATVMAKATEYIRHLEARNKAMSDEMAALKAQLSRVEAAMGSRESQGSTISDPTSGLSRSREVSSASQAGSPTFLNVPQDQTRFGQPMVQQQYMQPHNQPTYARPPNPPAEAQNQPQQPNVRGGGLVNKVVLGTMASVLAMEGFSEHQSGESPSAHQLFAVPTALLKRATFGSPTSSDFSQQASLSLLKLLLGIGALAYILLPLLSFTPRRKQKTCASVRLPQAPSLASPVEVRRKAWLTAVQTVWVPKHFLHEVVAVGFKMFQLSLRRMIGSEAFTAITGTTKEEEAARIKAWDIAIDAQLAGGDAQVSYYRLLLTLMESGTLPDSPARLMQKAVHFRVFFWEVANAGYGNMIGFKRFTEKVGRIYWDSARRLQKDLVHAKAHGIVFSDDELELLPDHLARLGELDCDEVLSDEMIQRAWNLAWNKQSANGITPNMAKDSVVEDHAIRSPLDAVAAWYTNTAIDDTLADVLGENASSMDTEYYLGLALSVAPPASSTHVRALAAKAVLSKTNREGNILIALEALPVLSPTGGMNLVSHAPASPDVCTALTLAKLIALCSPSLPKSARMRAFNALTGLQLAPAQFTLLTAVAAYRLLKSMLARKDLPKATEHGMEDLAGSLRIWVGTSTGRDSGLGTDGRRRVVRLCLDVAKQLGGWEERDSGYGTTSAASQSPVMT